MLVLSRKGGEQLRIGNDITITVLSVQGNRVKIGIDAPGDYRIIRAELSISEEEPTEEAPAEPARPAKPAARALQPAPRANKPAPQWANRREASPSRQYAAR